MSKDYKKHGPIVFYGFRPGPGGVSPVLVNLMNSMAQTGYQVHLLIDQSCPPDYPGINSDIHVINIQDSSRGKTITSLGNYFLQHRPVALLANKERANRLAIKAGQKVRFPVRIAIRVRTNNPFAYLARADLFVLSSAWEGSPNVLIEALAVGIPVVSTDCSFGPREILDNGRYGPLVPVGDVGTMAVKMIEMLDQPPTSEHLKSAARMYRPEHSTLDYLKALSVDA